MPAGFTRITQNGVAHTGDLLAIPGGHLSRGGAAETWLAMRYYVAATRPGVLITPGGPVSSFRSVREQEQEKANWTAAGHPEKAATPGTSNHGWGIAVDDPDFDSQRAIQEVGLVFDWSHAEGLRVGEAWHYTFVGHQMPKDWYYLTAAEVAKVMEIVRLQRHGVNLTRQHSVARWLGAQAHRIEHAAKHHGGWGTAHRQTRHHIITAHA